MKMKIQALYLTGTVLLIGAAGVGDSITFDAVGSWTGAAMRKVGQNNARGEKADCAAKKPERPVLRKIKDPTPLDYDVHDLILYNALAKKEGRPELTYGYWAAAGKPATPTTVAEPTAASGR